MLYVATWALLVAIPEPDVMPVWLHLLLHAYISVPMLSYVGLVLVTTFAPNPVVWLLTAAGVAASHFTYGIQFFRGITARRAPCEFIGADHA